MWVVVYMANDALVAEAVKAKLEEEGILVQLKNVYKKTGAAHKHREMEVRVLRSEAVLAQQVLLHINMAEVAGKREET